MKSYIHLYETNQEFTEAYNSPDYEEPWLSLTKENNAINYSKMLTAITFENLTWKTDIPATGGTATKGNCEYKIMAKYLRSEPEDITSQVTVTGKLIVAETTATTRQSVDTLTLTAEYKGVTCTGSVVAYQEAFDPSKEPLTFKITTPGIINWRATDSSVSKTIEYKLNDGEWTSITSSTIGVKINVDAGNKIQFRGNNTAYCDGVSSYNTFSGSTAGFEIEGNIMSLINPTDFATLTTLESANTFVRLFSDCTGLTSAENLILPATTLADYCYSGMFYGCTSLTTAPKLPVTTLADYCYARMFQDCTGLKTPPELPATALTESCYRDMFQNCSSLTTAPALPATTLANSCYQSMFYNCTSLTTAPELPATTLAGSCYQSMFYNCTSLTTAPELPATTLAGSCYDSMFCNCSSLTTAPFILPAMALVSSCYESMFKGCTSLTAAPELPATTLANSCYGRMFFNCESLNYIKCLATDISARDCTSNWVDGVAATGAFVKAASMSGWTTGSTGIPSGWDVEKYSDYTKEPLTFKILSGGTIYWSTSARSLSKTIEYKLNDGEWKSITSNTWTSAPTIKVNADDKIQFRGDNTAYGAYSSRDTLYNTFSTSTAIFEIEGNIMSLINSTNFAALTTLQSDYTFSYLFRNCTGLTSAENLILPATTLTSECYQYMFYGCTSLTTAPKLPATTLAIYCYYNMFDGCSSLKTAPELPATTLAWNCYRDMFYGCASLTTAPSILPANSLANYCYQSMFYNCKSLTTAPVLPATTLANRCYANMFYGCTSLNYIKCLATDISATNCTTDWVYDVAATGTFVKNPSMTKWLKSTSSIPSGWTVKDAS